MTSERWNRTEGLFHAALARPVGERAAFLAVACPDDDALRVDVESLLNEASSDEGFLHAPALVLPAQLVSDLKPGELAGRTLGTYHLQALLGSGGMCDVYRARDTTLDRDVALKILPPAFTSHADRLARFEREARMLAALNHPHICAIYGLEEADGLRFLVLELVEGKTLADTLAEYASGSPHGPGLALDAALNYAQQIAAALEAAHERGIIHRDLKPANIVITPGGVVKMLDFGLAKALAGEASSDDLTNAASDCRTVAGTIMGTASYMSAEQAAGKPVDRRTDVWAFGVVLFEMVAGRRPFGGETATETIASVLKTEPDWRALPATVPPDLRRLIRRCLEKDPKRRLQSIGDGRVHIEDLVRGASDDPLPGSQPVTRRPQALPWIMAGALAIGLAGTLAWIMAPEARPITRLGMTLPAAYRLDGGGGGHILALSPNGAHVAFVATPVGIYLRSMAEDSVKLIPGTEVHGSVREPVFSPDGREIAFFAQSDQTLKRVAITGGVAFTICPAKNPYGMTWGADGIVFGQGAQGIMRVSPEGGRPEPIATVKDDETAHGPQMLAGGHLLFTLATGTAADRWDKAQVILQAKSGERTALVSGGSDARYLPTGHIVYAMGGRLIARAFDERRLKVDGAPVAIVDGVKRSAANWSGAANFSVSNTGTLAYVPGPVSSGDALMDIALVDRRTGRVDALNLTPRRYTSPRVSPDGTLLAFGTEDGKEASVWIYHLDGTLPMQQLTIGGNNRFPVWTSANSVAFQSNREGDLAIFRQSIGGKAERITTPDRGATHTPASWTASTNTLLFSIRKGPELSLWSRSLQDGRTTLFTAVNASLPIYDPGAAFSPDGRWIAYASADKGATTIYVQPFPATGAIHKLAPQGADGPHEPVWSPDGTELFYNPRLGGFEVVRVTTVPSFAFGKPVALTRTVQMGPPGSRTNYYITTCGRFVGLITAGRTAFDEGADDRIQVVLNWFEDVKARVAKQ